MAVVWAEGEGKPRVVCPNRPIPCPGKKEPRNLGPTLPSRSSGEWRFPIAWTAGTPGRATRRLGPSALTPGPASTNRLAKSSGPAGRSSPPPRPPLDPRPSERWSRHAFGIRSGLR